jgi:hypothetical protein
MSTDTHHTTEVPMKIPGSKKTTALYVGHQDPLDEAYFPKLLTAMAGATPGKASIVTIRHDDWCPKLAGGPCRCDADVVVEGEE